MPSNYDFNSDANAFTDYQTMFLCMRDFMISDKYECPNYRELYESDLSILFETFNEVHMRELKRFIRSKRLTRDDAIRIIIQIMYEGSSGAYLMMSLIEEMLDYLISEGYYRVKPAIPYDLLFNTHFEGPDVTLADEVVKGGYNVRGALVDIFSNHYINFDVSSYADWRNIPCSIISNPDKNKKYNDPERFQYIKGYSCYLQCL